MRRPQRLDLGQDPPAELVSGPGERERRVRMQALQAPRAGARAGDSAGELRAQPLLLLVRTLETRTQLLVFRRRAAPALDSTRRLESGDGGDEVRAGEVEGGRERFAAVVERRLLRHRWLPVWTTDCDPFERARRAADLARDDGSIVHPARS